MNYVLRDLPPEWAAFRALCRKRRITAAEALRQFVARTVQDQQPRLRSDLFETGGDDGKDR